MKEKIRESQLLLNYALKHQFNLPVEVISVITLAKYVSEWDAVQEANFLGMYKTLTEMVTPVNIDTLKAISDEFGDESFGIPGIIKKKRTAHARKAVRFYSLMATLALLILIIVKSYWYISIELINEFNEKEQHHEQVFAERDSLRKALNTINAYSIDERTSANALDGMYIKNELKKNLVYQTGASGSLIASTHLLESFYKRWEGISAALGVDIDREEYNKEIVDSYKEKEAYEGKVLITPLTVPLDILEIYFFPLLYGFLGAIAFILRKMSRQIRDLTYIKRHNIGYNLRLILGVLSGLAIGWFLGGESGGNTKLDISPLALAFLAGYSVELLFVAIDNIIESLGAKQTG